VTETYGVQITGPAGERYDEILTDEALALVAELHRELGPRRAELLAARSRRQQELIAGGTLDFLPQTREVREDKSWHVAPPAPGLVDRRVEITGPTDTKMTINALNSGARVWLADFEDANTPLWDNMVTGQLNLKDALDRKIDFTSADGKSYQLRPDDELATIVVRPRGWHLDEKHLLVDGQRVSGSLFDFALYFAHCARRQLDKGKGPYFYLAKTESHLEARLGVRDGGDSLRAARAQRRAERGPLGLPVQHHQEVPYPGPRLRPARAQRGDDDRPVHARLHRAAGQDLS
jgi:malate synthase